MTVSRAPKRARRQPFSCHPSNPFDDADMAKRALGYGSSELSECSSDLGGYGDPEPTHYFEQTSGEESEQVQENEGQCNVSELETVGDDERNVETDEELEEEDPFWDEEEFEEEHSIYFKKVEERREIRAEIQDLQRAVPRLKEDYEILDRLGTGI